MRQNKESIRIFKNPFLESLTHVHPIVPLVLWVPIISYLLYSANEIYAYSLTEWGALLFIGLFVWTLMEYLLHRFMFHFPAKSKIGKRFVFLFHGLHHDDADDPTRLVMPPFPAILITSLLYLGFSTVVPLRYLDAFFAFFLIGYLIYDYIHYATHFFPMNSKVGKYLKRHHLRHHYVEHDAKYGVSNPLWDIVFGTLHGTKSKK